MLGTTATLLSSQTMGPSMASGDGTKDPGPLLGPATTLATAMGPLMVTAAISVTLMHTGVHIKAQSGSTSAGGNAALAAAAAAVGAPRSIAKGDEGAGARVEVAEGVGAGVEVVGVAVVEVGVGAIGGSSRFRMGEKS